MIRCRPASLALSILLACLASVGGLSLLPQAASAGIVPGEYSLGVTATESSGTVTVHVNIEHDGTNPGKYQAVEWNVDYSQDVVSGGAIVADPAAPDQCAFSNDDGNRLLLGCIDLQGDNLTYSGVAFDATFFCLHAGTATFQIASLQGVDPDADTFVATGHGNPPIHTHDASVQCTASSPNATPPATPVPGVVPTTAPTAAAGSPVPGNPTPQRPPPAAGSTEAAVATALSVAGATASSGSSSPQAGTTAAAATATSLSRTAVASGTKTAGSTSNSKSGDGFPGWAIALIVVGGVVVAGGAAIGFTALRRRP